MLVNEINIRNQASEYKIKNSIFIWKQMRFKWYKQKVIYIGFVIFSFTLETKIKKSKDDLIVNSPTPKKWKGGRRNKPQQTCKWLRRPHIIKIQQTSLPGDQREIFANTSLPACFEFERRRRQFVYNLRKGDSPAKEAIWVDKKVLTLLGSS